MYINKMKLFTILIFMITITGCDTFRGVTRVAYFKPVPASECVIASAKSIEGLTEIEYFKESGGKPLTLQGIEKADVVHHYRYIYKGIKNSFSFTESYNGKVQFRHGYGCLHCYPSQEAVNTIYSFIIKIENELQNRCDVNDFSSGVKEYCSGVKCPGK